MKNSMQLEIGKRYAISQIEEEIKEYDIICKKPDFDIDGNLSSAEVAVLPLCRHCTENTVRMREIHEKMTMENPADNYFIIEGKRDLNTVLGLKTSLYGREIFISEETLADNRELLRAQESESVIVNCLYIIDSMMEDGAQEFKKEYSSKIRNKRIENLKEIIEIIVTSAGKAYSMIGTKLSNQVKASSLWKYINKENWNYINSFEVAASGVIELLEQIKEVFEEGENIIDFAKGTRELKKATRGRFNSVGFGIGGAVGGMITSGLANAAYGGIYSVSNHFANIATEAKTMKKINSFLHSDEMCNHIYDVAIDDFNNLKENYRIILESAIDYAYPNRNEIDRNTIEAYYNKFIDKNFGLNKERAVIRDIIQKYPLYEKAYEYSLKNWGDPDGEWDEIGEFTKYDVEGIKKRIISEFELEIKSRIFTSEEERNADENNLIKLYKNLGCYNEKSKDYISQLICEIDLLSRTFNNSEFNTYEEVSQAKETFEKAKEIVSKINWDDYDSLWKAKNELEKYNIKYIDQYDLQRINETVTLINGINYKTYEEGLNAWNQYHTAKNIIKKVDWNSHHSVCRAKYDLDKINKDFVDSKDMEKVEKVSRTFRNIEYEDIAACDIAMREYDFVSNKIRLCNSSDEKAYEILNELHKNKFIKYCPEEELKALEKKCAKLIKKDLNIESKNNYHETINRLEKLGCQYYNVEKDIEIIERKRQDFENELKKQIEDLSSKRNDLILKMEEDKKDISAYSKYAYSIKINKHIFTVAGFVILLFLGEMGNEGILSNTAVGILAIISVVVLFNAKKVAVEISEENCKKRESYERAQSRFNAKSGELVDIDEQIKKINKKLFA